MSNKIFCFFNQGFQNLMSEINMMPVIGIWVSICPKNLEATSITLFTGILNFSNQMGSFLGAFVQNVLKVGDDNSE